MWVPNFSDWQPGDVVLVATAGDKAGKAVQLIQQLSQPQRDHEAARFTHAAVYVGNGTVIDAVPSGPIAPRSVWAYCQFRDLMLRRVPARGDASSAVANIAKAAQRHVGKPYSLSAAAVAVLLPDTAPDRERLFCSSFVDLVVAEATDLLLSSRREHRPLLPATLVNHPELQPVQLEWRTRGGR
jgi:hypothetical protein